MNFSKKRFRGELTLEILKFLADNALLLDELLASLLVSRFRRGGVSKKELSFYFEEQRKRERATREFNTYLKEKHMIASLINQFQKAGLVKKKENIGRKALWAITQKGLDKIFRLKNSVLNSKNKINLPPKIYPIKLSKQTIIISFDIAESEKEKRAWLRDVLKNLDYKMLQKSVWIGTNQLPETLIRDLKKLNIFKNVKIFSVLEKGNIFEE